MAASVPPPQIQPPPHWGGIEAPVLLITLYRKILCDWYTLAGASLTHCPKIATHCAVYADAHTHYRCGPHATTGRQSGAYADLAQRRDHQD